MSELRKELVVAHVYVSVNNIVYVPKSSTSLKFLSFPQMLYFIKRFHIDWERYRTICSRQTHTQNPIQKHPDEIIYHMLSASGLDKVSFILDLSKFQTEIFCAVGLNCGYKIHKTFFHSNLISRQVWSACCFWTLYFSIHVR